MVYRYEGLFVDDVTLEENWLLIVEALELRLEPGDYSDPAKLNFTWEMRAYNEGTIVIQLFFEYP